MTHVTGHGDQIGSSSEVYKYDGPRTVRVLYRGTRRENGLREFGQPQTGPRGAAPSTVLLAPPILLRTALAERLLPNPMLLSADGVAQGLDWDDAGEERDRGSDRGGGSHMKGSR